MQIGKIKRDSSTKTKEPKISIGVPVYNLENYIGSTLDSVLSQTFKDFEIIISDNASTDMTEKICREYAAIDSRVLYYRQFKNTGGIANFKNVLEKSNGKYFMWLSADDMLGNDDYLKFLNDEISENYDYYFTEVSLIDSSGQIKRSNAMHLFQNCKTQLDLFEASLTENAMHLYSLFFKEKLINDFKYLEMCKDLHSCNEGLFVHVINATRKGKFVNKAIKLYRKHKESWSSSVNFRNLVISQAIYAYKSILFILKHTNFTFVNKIIFSMRVFYTSSKAILFFTLHRFWQVSGLHKLLFLKKFIKNFMK